MGRHQTKSWASPFWGWIWKSGPRNPPPEYRRLYNEYLDAVARDRLLDWLETETPEVVGIALLVAHPDWSIKDIADKLKCDRKTPYRWHEFMKFFNIFKAGRKAERRNLTPRGSKFTTEDGAVLEAIDPAFEEGEEDNDSEDFD